MEFSSNVSSGSNNLNDRVINDISLEYILYQLSASRAMSLFLDSRTIWLLFGLSHSNIPPCFPCLIDCGANWNSACAFANILCLWIKKQIHDSSTALTSTGYLHSFHMIKKSATGITQEHLFHVAAFVPLSFPLPIWIPY